MDAFNRNAFKAELERDEGRCTRPYQDSLGIWTVGIGWNLEARGLPAGVHYLTEGGSITTTVEYLPPATCIAAAELGFTLTDASVDMLLGISIEDAIGDARALFPSFDELSDARQRVVVNMAFNMGRDRLKGFSKMIGAVHCEDWNEAAEQMIDSEWYREFDRLGSKRARRLVKMMREG